MYWLPRPDRNAALIMMSGVPGGDMIYVPVAKRLTLPVVLPMGDKSDMFGDLQVTV